LPPHIKNNLFITIVIFIAASVLVAIIGYNFYQNQKKYISASSQKQLMAIADLQVREISNWRNERIGDAQVIINNDVFTKSTIKYLNDPSASEAKNIILSSLKATQKSYQYKNILLLDRNKKVRLALHKFVADYSLIHSSVIDEAIKKRGIVFGDFYRENKNGSVYLTMAFPIINALGKNAPIIGTIVIVLDPTLRLYPSIKEWPLPTSTGETLLVRRESNEIVYLNELRHDKNKPLTIRLPLSEADLPAVKAVLGQKGIVEGRDYRKKNVLAAIGSVPDSPWFFVVKIDGEEIYASLRLRYWVTLSFVVIGILIFGIIVAYIWRDQQARFYRKQYETEYKRAFLYARGLIETSLDPLVTISAEGKIMDVNKSTELVTGLSREKLIGSRFSDYFTEPEKAAGGYKLAFEKGLIRDYPLSIRNISGQATDVLYNASVYKNESGEVQGIFAAARDITELKRIEKELKKAHDELELRVEERTNELQKTNEYLQEEIRERKVAEKLIDLRTRLLEETNKELESFSYSVSHDLRAPLRAVDGYARMILRDQADKLDHDARRKFELIRSNTQMMGKLIDDLLSFSRLGRMEINMTRLDMEGLINDVWKELQIINPERKLDLNITNVPAGNGDRTLIKQVYSNLFSNAVKFTKNRKNTSIETGGYVKGQENIYYVKDNGVGFDMDYYDKLFGVFQRLHSADEFEGTGVGLAIVQRIIHKHGGRVWAEGKAEEGATFYFTLSRKD